MMLWMAPTPTGSAERHTCQDCCIGNVGNAAMIQPTVVGLDLAKQVFQVHGVDGDGQAVVRRTLRRSEVIGYFRKLAPCLIGMEACGTAHYWGRELAALGHEVRLMPAGYVKPYIKRGKNDAVDAEAICEAVTRPTMRFVAVKSAEQQAILMLHRTRDLLVRQRTMLVNSLRGQLAEFGLVAPKGVWRIPELDALAEGANEDALPAPARECARLLLVQIADLQGNIKTIEKEIVARHKTNELSQRLATIPGVGTIHGDGHGRDGRRCWLLQVRTALRILAWPCTATEWHWRENGAGQHLQEGRALLAKIAGARRHGCRPLCAQQAGAGRLGQRAAGATTGPCRDGSGRQQAGADRLGDHEQGRHLPRATLRHRMSEDR